MIQRVKGVQSARGVQLSWIPVVAVGPLLELALTRLARLNNFDRARMASALVISNLGKLAQKTDFCFLTVSLMF